MNTTHSNAGRPVPSGAGNGPGDAIASRFDPGALRVQRDLTRRSFGLFCAELERLKCPPLSPTMLLLGKLIGEVTLKEGFSSVPLERLESLVEVGDGSFIVNLHRNDLSVALNGSPASKDRAQVRGLMDLGIVRLEPLAGVGNGGNGGGDRRGWVLLVFADSALWRVGAPEWRFTPEQKLAWRVHLASERRRHTPFMMGLAPVADLYDGLAASDANMKYSDSSDALVANDGEREAADGHSRSSFLSGNAGARVVADGDRTRPVSRSVAPRCSESQNGGGACKQPCSESRNKFLRENVGDSPPRSGSQNALSIERKVKGHLALGIGSLPIESVMSREELKAGLHGDEREFCTAARQIIGAVNWEDGRPHPQRWQGDGSKWRARHRHIPSRETVVRAFLEVMERPGKSQAATVERRWQEFGGRALDAARLGNANEGDSSPAKKSKESFINPYKAT